MTLIFSLPLLVPALLVVYSTSHVLAAPSCEQSWISALMPCIMPAVEYVSSSDATQLMALLQTERQQEITESQVKSLCKTVQGILACSADYITRCLAPNNAGVQQLIAGTSKLLRVCDSPDLYRQSMVVLKCNAMLNASSPVVQTCMDSVKNSIPYLKNLDKNGAMMAFTSGSIVKDMCCATKQLYGCQEPEMQKCSTEAVSLNKATYDAVLEAYACSAQISSGCPAA